MRTLYLAPAGAPIPAAGSSARALRPATGPFALAAIGAAILAIIGNGVEATLSALADGGRSPEITSGTLLLTVDDAGTGFSTDITDLAPGDIVDRFLDVTNAGSLDASDLTLELSAAGAAALITNGTAPATTKALTVAVDICTVAWDRSTSTCSGTASNVVAAAPLSTLIGPAISIATDVSSSDVLHLRVRVQLPDQDETSVNGTLPSPTVQGSAATLTVDLRAEQRDPMALSD
jgi:hypothetical protein